MTSRFDRANKTKWYEVDGKRYPYCPSPRIELCYGCEVVDLCEFNRQFDKWFCEDKETCTYRCQREAG